MMRIRNWQSPDGKFSKFIVDPGYYGNKPVENSECYIVISNFEPLEMLNDIQTEYIGDENDLVKVLIGSANTSFDREVDVILQSMKENEKSTVTLHFGDKLITFDLKLVRFKFNGYIHEWSAAQKCILAHAHNDVGNDLFVAHRYQDASFRFSKALKLVLAILIPVDEPVETIDSVPVFEINELRAKLYNNLASCYSKLHKFEVSVDLCTKVLEITKDNVKALFKRGFAYAALRDFENAQADLNKVLELDPTNKATKDKLKYVNFNIEKQEAMYANIVRKMFTK